MALDSATPIAIIGTGALGSALARSIRASGRTLGCVCSPSGSKALADELGVRFTSIEQAAQACAVFLCVPDGAIEEVCDGLTWHPGQLVAHTSGALDLAPLSSAEALGAAVGSLHPVMVLNRSDIDASALPGATAAIEGDAIAGPWLSELATDLRMRPVAIVPAHRPLYHASAALIGGLMTGLLSEAAHLWAHVGLDAETGAAALGPMVQRAGANLTSLGADGVVMGPAARGDVETIRAHVAALREAAPHLLGLHRELVLSCLRRTSLPEDVQASIRASLDEASHSDGSVAAST